MTEEQLERLIPKITTGRYEPFIAEQDWMASLRVALSCSAFFRLRYEAVSRVGLNSTDTLRMLVLDLAYQQEAHSLLMCEAAGQLSNLHKDCLIQTVEELRRQLTTALERARAPICSPAHKGKESFS